MSDRMIGRVALHGVSAMTPRGRADIANWLRAVSYTVEDEGTNFSKLFTAKYFAVNRKPRRDERKGNGAR